MDQIGQASSEQPPLIRRAALCCTNHLPPLDAPLQHGGCPSRIPPEPEEQFADHPHARRGTPPSIAGLAQRYPCALPKVDRSATSASITSARRRTPSLIRSGSGKAVGEPEMAYP